MKNGTDWWECSESILFERSVKEAVKTFQMTLMSRVESWSDWSNEYDGSIEAEKEADGEYGWWWKPG